MLCSGTPQWFRDFSGESNVFLVCAACALPMNGTNDEKVGRTYFIPCSDNEKHHKGKKTVHANFIRIHARCAVVFDHLMRTRNWDVQCRSIPYYYHALPQDQRVAEWSITLKEKVFSTPARVCLWCEAREQTGKEFIACAKCKFSYYCGEYCMNKDASHCEE